MEIDLTKKNEETVSFTNRIDLSELQNAVTSIKFELKKVIEMWENFIINRREKNVD